MLPIDKARRRKLGELFCQWWQDWQRKRNALTELESCGSELEHVARDVGVTPRELQVLAAKRPDSANLLHQRLALLKLDAKRIAVTEGAVLRDLQRLCSCCESKRRCARDLAGHSSAPDWQDYCPNAETLEALTIEADDEKALARLERRAARPRRTR